MTLETRRQHQRGLHSLRGLPYEWMGAAVCPPRARRPCGEAQQTTGTTRMPPTRAEALPQRP
jgi:hypothetical protein